MYKESGRVGRNESIRERVACLGLSAALVLGCMGMAGCSQAATDEGQGENGDNGNSAGTLIADVANMDRSYTERDKDPSYDEASATRIALKRTTAETSASTDTTGSSGVSVAGSTVTISAEGTYIVSGSLTDGQLVVDATDTDKIQIVLDNVAIHNEDGPAVHIMQADKCFITLADGSTNTLSDGASYTLEDGTDEPYATLFSKDDLTINGSGALTVKAAYRHGICSKDDLVICGGTIQVTSAEDALRGRDCVKIADGTFIIDAGEDAIKSNNDEDPTRGFVSIDGGTFAINAGDDAVHGEFAVFVDDGQIEVGSCVEGLEGQQVYINGGTVDIVSSDDSINASSPRESTTTSQPTAGFPGNMLEDAAEASNIADANRPDAQMAVPETNGTTPPDMQEEAAPPDVPEGTGAPDFRGRTDAGGTPEAGSREADRQQGAAGNAGPKADKGGEMPSDLDAGGTRDAGANGGMPGDIAEEGCLIEINGGLISLVTEGDGIDSNGDFTMNGGTLFVSGPTNGGNGSLDVNGEAMINGGTVLMAGSSEMAQSFSGGSQAFLSTKISGASGETVSVIDPSGEQICSFTPKARFAFVVASCPQMKAGTSYTITAGQSSAEAQTGI